MGEEVSMCVAVLSDDKCFCLLCSSTLQRRRLVQCLDRSTATEVSVS